MRILQLVADGSPGGGTTHLLQILKGLSDEYEMALLSQPNSYLIQQAQSMGIQSYQADLFPPGAILAAGDRIRSVVKEFSPDIIHVHGGRAAFFLFLSKIMPPWVYTIHGYHFSDAYPPIRWLRGAVERAISRSAAKLIFVSQHDLEFARKKVFFSHEGKARLIYNGVPPLPEAKYSQEGVIRIGWIGRLNRAKDPLFFLHIMEALPEFEGIMIGGGLLMDRVVREVENRKLRNVEIIGALEHGEALERMRDLDLLVITSQKEAFGIVAAEAMRMGIPIVAAAVGGLSEVIEDRVSGILVDERDPQFYAREIHRLDEDASMRRRIIASGKRRVEEKFSQERMLAEIQKVYEDFSNSGKG